jgi:hypothetical protein
MDRTEERRVVWKLLGYRRFEDLAAAKAITRL